MRKQRAHRMLVTGLAMLALWLLALAGADPASAQNPDTVSSGKRALGARAASRIAAPSARRATRDRAVASRSVIRSILALYDSGDEQSAERTRLHRLLEMPLNHLGYHLSYWDIRDGLPPVAQVRRHRAVATWFDERLPDPGAYLAWANAVAKARIPFVIMDFLGAPLDEPWLPAANAFLAHMGMSARSIWVPPSPDLRVVSQNTATIGFERKLDGVLPGFMVYRATRASTRSHMVVAGRSGPNQPEQTSHPVVTGPGGGFAAYGFAAVYDEKTERLGWVLNPFEFLRAALGDGDAPVPDTTTLVGRRIYFSHIDGDGWNSVSRIERPGRVQSLVSEVVLENLVKAYPDLPVSVGLIAGDVDPTVASKPQSARIAREFFSLPQVEVASHSYTHPYNWGAFALPAKEQEAAQLASTNPLRAYAQRDFDLNREVAGSLDVAATLAPAGKPPALFLWSGNTRPFPQAIQATRAAGVRNLNGGDSRFDTLYPSIAYLSALARQAGSERQIYSANANETIYTNGWTAPFDRFKFLAETVARTETPRRLKAFNVYYHMYSGEHPESLAAVREHLDTARAGDNVPIHTSHYAAIADSFFGVTITRTAADTWSIGDRGELHTVRFDAAGDAAPDYTRSSGILGHTRHAGSLYVALDPEHPTAVVAVSRTPRAPARPLNRPILVESRWPLAGLKGDACRFEVDARGFGPGRMTWIGLRPGGYTVSAWRGEVELATVVATADAAGHLTVSLSVDAQAGARIVAHCQS